MTTTLFAPPLSEPLPSPPKKKRVLLVDTSPSKCDLRADAMRKCGMDVDCAADIVEAHSWWRAGLYDLVLINMEEGPGHRDKFCNVIRNATPPQRVAFLVGKPEYLADSPNAEDGSSVAQQSDGLASLEDGRIAFAATIGDLPQNWGILEASRRINAVRSAASARTRAMRDRPLPPRDSELRPSKRTTISPTLDDLLRKEMQ